MAKDPVMGPISNPDGGVYEPSEEVEAEIEVEVEAEIEVEVEVEEILTQPPIIDLFGEKAGQLLLDAGYSSVDAVMAADDEVLLNTKGIGKAALKKIRGLSPPREIPEMISPTGIEAEQEESPTSVRIRRIREASQS